MVYLKIKKPMYLPYDIYKLDLRVFFQSHSFTSFFDSESKNLTSKIVLFFSKIHILKNTENLPNYNHYVTPAPFSVSNKYFVQS